MAWQAAGTLAILPKRDRNLWQRSSPLSDPAFTDAELLAFLSEELAPERSSLLETKLREDDGLRQRLINVRGQQMAGVHTIGAIWRRLRLSCPSRELLQQHLMGLLDEPADQTVRFHLQQVGCRYCQANLDDLNEQMSGANRETRRTRWFQTSAGHLRSNR